MNSLIAYFGLLYIFIGALFLSVPIIYLELGRPKDLIKAFLNLIIGFILIIKNKSLDESFFVIFLLLTTLVVLYNIEMFSSRWNQLTAKEKKKLTTFLEFKNNLSKLFEAFNLAIKDILKSSNYLNLIRNNQNINPKKWVRNVKNDNIKT